MYFQFLLLQIFMNLCLSTYMGVKFLKLTFLGMLLVNIADYLSMHIWNVYAQLP